MDAPTEFSHHALMRFREHYPEATSMHAREAWLKGEDLTAEVAAAVLCRRTQSVRDQYRLTQDGRGLFVAKGARVITYLRLSVVATRILRPPQEPAPAPEPPPPPKAKVKGPKPVDLGEGFKADARKTIEGYVGRKLSVAQVSSQLEAWLGLNKLTKWATLARVARFMDPEKLHVRMGDCLIFVDEDALRGGRLRFTYRDLEPRER